MSARYVINWNDHAEARATLAGKSHTRPSLGCGIVAWALFMGLCVMLLVLLSQKPRKQPSAGEDGAAPRPAPSSRTHLIVGLSMLGAGAALLFIGFKWLRRFSLVGAGETVALDFVADGLSFSNTDLRIELPWSAFDGFSETPRLFVLRQPPNTFRPIPKEAFTSDAERDRFAQTLRDHLPDLRAGAGAGAGS